jgi:hypothetical protein
MLEGSSRMLVDAIIRGCDDDPRAAVVAMLKINS